MVTKKKKTDREKCIELLKPCMFLLVDSNSMRVNILSDAIAWSCYPKDYEGIKVNHGGILFPDNSDKYWVSEEKYLFTGVGNTSIEDYLAKPYTLVFRSLKTPLIKSQKDKLDYICTKQSKRYRIGGLGTELWQNSRYKIAVKIQDIRKKLFGKSKDVDPKKFEVNYKYKEGVHICSEWQGVVADFVTGLFPDKKGKSPKDWQEDNRLVDVMIWNGQEQKLTIL